jgi:creatinine amidohydrolase
MTRWILAMYSAVATLCGAPAATNAEQVSAHQISGPTMLEMTWPEFAKAVTTTNIMLLPVGSIEEHGPHLPLNSDAIGAVHQLVTVQAVLRERGIDTIVGPTTNVGITNEAADASRDGTYMYPGSLTLPVDTFVRLYVDLLRSLRANGIRTVFMYSGHLGGRHLTAVARAATEASATIPGLRVYALIDTERLERLSLPTSAVLAIERGLNFEMLRQLLGDGPEPSVSTHADGWETSLLLYYRPDVVRPEYTHLPQASSAQFFAAGEAGDTSKNPSGIGGFPLRKASAAVGRQIDSYRAGRIVGAILKILEPR